MTNPLQPGDIHPAYHNNLNDPTPAQKQQLSHDLETYRNLSLIMLDEKAVCLQQPTQQNEDAYERAFQHAAAGFQNCLTQNDV